MGDPEHVQTLQRCTCGEPATANERECGSCYRSRLGSVSVGFAPTAGVDIAGNRIAARKLERYAQARREGIQPVTTQERDVDMAMRASDETGQAFRADTGGM